MRIGFVGLGMMGKPMAINLMQAGQTVTVVNRSQGKVQELAAMGAHVGANPAAATRDADIVALCLVGDSVVEEVLCGTDGVLSAVNPGAIILDHSTVHPEFARRMAAACAAHGAVYLDAPVSGTGQIAWDGRLTVMLGGDADACERAKPALDAVSANARLMGPVGSGNMAKLINNMVKDINQIAVMETFVLGARLGVDCGALFQVTRSGESASRQLSRIMPKILDRSFEQSSYVSTNIKDQGLMGWMIDQAGMELPLRNAARDLWLRASEQGLAGADPTEAIKTFEREAGIEVSGEALPPDAPAPSDGGLYAQLGSALAAIYQVGIFEALVLAAKMGMDCGALLEVMRTASAASTQIERIGGGILDREFDGLGTPVSASLELQQSLIGMADAAGFHLPMHRVAADVWQRSIAAGLTNSAEAVTLYERAAGVEAQRAGVGG